MVLKEKSSFRDPAGKVVRAGNRIQRIIYDAKSYDKLMSGLYQELAQKSLIIAHQEVSPYVIEPDIVPFISYPYEWPFAHLQKAAVATLEIAITALEYDMVLKDASAFNIQYHEGNWKLIDTMSFLPYEPNQTWNAYAQFLRHFHYPLLFRMYHIPFPYWQNIDGAQPKDASKLLPCRLRLNPMRAVHIYPMAHSKCGTDTPVPKKRMVAFLTLLRDSVRSWKCKPVKGWEQYQSCSYSGKALAHKNELVRALLRSAKCQRGIDLGANTGDYTSMARNLGIDTIAIDSDHDCANAVEPLGLWADICNPTPAIGWNNEERVSLLDRLSRWNKGGLVMALALVHHLCIANNVPVSMVLGLFARLGSWLIIEYVSPDDPKALQLAGNRVFPEYNQGLFEKELGERYTVCRVEPIADSKRVLYLAKKR